MKVIQKYLNNSLRNFNYIIYNPLKHKLVSNLERSYHYKYSSNTIWLERFTAEGLSKGFVRYPVKHDTLIEDKE